MPPQHTTLCSVPDCGKRAEKRGWCSMHYSRWKHHGSLEKPAKVLPRQNRPRHLPTRFWAKVDKNGPIPVHRPDLGPCWVWTGRAESNGYGRFTKTHGHPVGAHRMAYELAVGPIPSELTIDHLCRNHICVNPEHLEAVTQQVNTLRGETSAAANTRKTHCPQGHPYDLLNTRYDKRGSRYCLRCKAIKTAAWRLAHA